MENVCLKGTAEEDVTPPGGEALGRNFHVIHYERIIKYSYWYGQECLATRGWKSDSVKNLVYMICDGGCDSNLDMDLILFIMYEWDEEDGMDALPTIHVR